MRTQRGAAAVEFALVLLVFMGLVIGVMEFARVIFIYATAVETTRLGARVAAVCASGDAYAIRSRMQAMLPLLTAGNIDITYPTTSCRPASCEPIRVRLTGVKVKLMIPLAGLEIPVPAFSTSLPAESLDSDRNPMCL